MSGNKWYIRAGYIIYPVLILFSILFFRERTAFIDISYHLFYILKDSSFAIQNNRFGAALTQWIPLSGAKLGLSLKTIALAYSAGFAITYFAVFILIHKILKNNRVALAWLFFSVLMTTHTFYWIQSELPQGAAFFFIFLALLDNQLKKGSASYVFYWLSAVLLFIICFTHPLLLFACLFSFIFLWNLYPQKRSLIYFSAATYLSFYVLKAVFFQTSYENSAFGGLKNIFTLFPDYFDIQSNKNLLKYFFTDYYFVPIGLALLLFFYIKTKRYIPAVLTAVFFTGYIFMVDLTYPGGTDQFYIENQYLLLAVFIGLPLAFELMNIEPLWRNGIVFLIGFFAVFRIYYAHDLYSARLDWQRNILLEAERLPSQKLILADENLPEDTLLMTWAASYEFWVLSTIENAKSASVIVEEQPGEFDWAAGEHQSFITKWGAFKYSDLNPKYFRFTDSTAYIKVHREPDGDLSLNRQ